MSQEGNIKFKDEVSFLPKFLEIIIALIALYCLWSFVQDPAIPTFILFFIIGIILPCFGKMVTILDDDEVKVIFGYFKLQRNLTVIVKTSCWYVLCCSGWYG